MNGLAGARVVVGAKVVVRVGVGLRVGGTLGSSVNNFC